MSAPVYDKHAAQRLRHILSRFGLEVPLSDEEMMGEGLFTTLGMVRGALDRRQPFAWVMRNAGFDSGAANFGAKCPPGWVGLAQPCYAAPQPAVVLLPEATAPCKG